MLIGLPGLVGAVPAAQSACVSSAESRLAVLAWRGTRRRVVDGHGWCHPCCPEEGEPAARRWTRREQQVQSLSRKEHRAFRGQRGRVRGQEGEMGQGDQGRPLGP